MANLEEILNDTTKKDMKKNKIFRILIGIVILIALVFSMHIFNSIANKDFSTYKILSTIERADSNSVQYLKYGNKLLKYSRDGVSALDNKGNVIWNSTYDMKDPKADICGDFVAVADIGSKILYVFDKEGKAAKVETLLPILQAKVAEQGVVAVLLQDKDGNNVSLYYPYDTSNSLLIDFKTSNEDGYPIDIDISHDGKKLVTSYLSTQNGVAENAVTFYNFSEVGENEINNIVGTFIYKQIIVPKVEFLTNSIVCAFAEDKFSLYSIKEQPELIHEETLKTEIKSIFYDEEHVGFILENLEGSKKYKIMVYDLKGKKVLEKKVDYDYENVSIYGDDIIFKTNLECYILRMNGKEKFHGRFDKNISYIYPADRLNRYYFINDTNIEEIKLTEDNE